MHDTYKPGLRLSRIDKAKWFCKDNCTWLTDEENSYLRGDHIKIEYSGKNLTFKEWSAEIGVSAYAIKNRYYKHSDWDVKDILYGKRKKRGGKPVRDWHVSSMAIR